MLSCGDTCQIWMWYLLGTKCFDNNKNLRNNRTGEIDIYPGQGPISQTIFQS